MAEAILYTLEIKGTQTELDKLALINDRMDELKGQVKTLSATDKAAAEEKKGQLKLEQEAYRNLQKEVINNTKAANDGVKTLGSMRAQLLNMNKELDKTKYGSEKFKKLTEDSKKLRAEINGANEATGRFQGNVGDYKNQITSAFQAMGVDVGKFTKVTELMSPAMAGVTTATTGTSTAMKVLKLALIATGIGAFVVVLGALATAFFSTQEGADKLNKVLIPIKTVFQRLIGLTQELGTLISAVSSFDREKISAALDDFKAGFAGMGDEIRGAIKDGERLAQIIIDIDNAKIEQAKNEGRLTREMAEQKAIIEDLSNSDKVRKAAGAEYLALNKQVQSYQQEIVKLELEQLTIKAAQNDTDRAAQLELELKRAESDTIKAAALQKEQEIKNKITGIDQAAGKARLKTIDDEKKASEVALKKRMEAILKIAESQMDADINAAMAFIEREDIANEVELERLAEFEQAKLDIKEAFRVEKLSSEEVEQEKIKSLYDKGLIDFDTFEAKKAEITKKYADQKTEIDKQVNLSKVQVASDAFGQLSEIFGKESDAGKAAAIAQASMQTYLSANAAYAAALLAFPGPGGLILAPIMAGIAVVSGLMNVKKIAMTPKPKLAKLAKGVIGLNGGGTGTSDSVDAKLSAGESVLTAKATSKYAPVLADMERSVGNIPNIQFGRGRFASGFIAGDIAPRGQFTSDTERAMNQLLNNVLNIPVVVSETDITGTQDKVRKIKVTGDL